MKRIGLRIYMLENLKARIDKAAQEADVSVSQWMRQAAEERLAREAAKE